MIERRTDIVHIGPKRHCFVAKRCNNQRLLVEFLNFGTVQCADPLLTCASLHQTTNGQSLTARGEQARMGMCVPRASFNWSNHG
jgi:hypothetical protein